MKTGNKLLSLIFHPLLPPLIYCFLAITTLHMNSPLLLKIHFEFITLVGAILLAIVQFKLIDQDTLTFNHSLMFPIIMVSLFAISPLLTSLINNDQLKVLFEDEYKTLVKMLLFVPCLFFIMSKKKYINTYVNSYIVFYSLFGIYFLYRFLYLHEVRDFDLRPSLNIRHGDANFLCTFFAMVVPLPLMQAWRAKENKQLLKVLLFSLIALFLLICAYLTESRMGLISTLIGLIYLISKPIWRIPRSVLFSIFISLMIVLMAIKGEHVLNRFSDIRDKSNTDRYLTFKNGIEVFKTSPLFGVGMNQARFYFYSNTGYPPFQNDFKQLEVHNTFLKLAAECGIFGLILFIIFIYWPWYKVSKMTSSSKYFLSSSLIIFTLSCLTIGIGYKDLVILHLFSIATLSIGLDTNL